MKAISNVGGGSIAAGVSYTNTTSGMTATDVQGAIDELHSDLFDLLTGTIAAGATSVTIQDAKIQTTSLIDIYFENKFIVPTNVTVTTGQIVIEIEAEQTATNVGVRVLNA